jgi:hypothetical protein
LSLDNENGDLPSRKRYGKARESAGRFRVHHSFCAIVAAVVSRSKRRNKQPGAGCSGHSHGHEHGHRTINPIGSLWNEFKSQHSRLVFIILQISVKSRIDYPFTYYSPLVA